MIKIAYYTAIKVIHNVLVKLALEQFLLFIPFLLITK